ncbi:elicitor-responsive protein 3-like isoform X2 [Panicum miliaceum]|uniref:Elicitor-responsive protein 3-like isoform X2 n=1 Tax=Panicum miliaceum TaxID=4540 RepID=A0A3L6QJU8_PANMI|nr:elicitor-responsive protein 3-like isoform X2 [Panicum miliaceum]
MVHGTLEVLLVGAKGLENTDYLCNMDPYAILKCRSQEQRSSIAAGKGTNPEWNENFVFTVTDQTTDLLIKLMDSDTGTADDFVGEATIPLEAVYSERSIPPTIYNVVKGEKYCGEIKVGLTFTPEAHSIIEDSSLNTLRFLVMRCSGVKYYQLYICAEIQLAVLKLLDHLPEIFSLDVQPWNHLNMNFQSCSFVQRSSNMSKY